MSLLQRFPRYEKWQKERLQLIVIAAVLIVSAIPVFWESSKTILIIFAGILGVLSILYLISNPQVGLPLLMLVTILVPFEIGTGTQTSLSAGVLLLVALLCLWVFDMIARERRINLAASPALIPLLVLLGVALLSFVNGQLLWFSIPPAPIRAQIGGLIIFLLVVVAYLVPANLLTDVRWLRWMVWAFMAAAAANLILFQYFPIYLNSFATLYYRYFSTGVVGSLFWLWIAAIGVSQGLYNRRLHWAARILLLLVVASSFYISLTILKDWTSGWLPAAIVVFIVILLGSPRWGVALIGLLGIVLVFQPTMITNLLISDNQYSIDTRLAAWSILEQIARINPILGFGPANYYWYTPMFHILGYFVTFNSHNNYVDIIAQTGITGMLFYLLFVYQAGRQGWRLYQKVKGDGFERAYVIGCIAGLIGMLVAGMFGDWVIPFVYNVGLSGFRSAMYGWLFLGSLSALEVIVDRGAGESPVQKD